MMVVFLRIDPEQWNGSGNMLEYAGRCTGTGICPAAAGRSILAQISNCVIWGLGGCARACRRTLLRHSPTRRHKRDFDLASIRDNPVQD
jgi:hypothetical protein